MNSAQRLQKRLLDLILGGLTMLLALPIMLIVIIAIKIDTRGSALFRQERIGENGRVFRMFKFRTMVVGAEYIRHSLDQSSDDISHKYKDDPRVTSIGRFLRRTSLDELPQLFNVLNGDMSLVGPRPELSWIVEQYEPWQHQRFTVPQGMTGWWQINGRSTKPMHLNTQDDIYYIQHYSLRLDFYILLKTAFTVINKNGAY